MSYTDFDVIRVMAETIEKADEITVAPDSLRNDGLFAFASMLTGLDRATLEDRLQDLLKNANDVAPLDQRDKDTFYEKTRSIAGQFDGH